MKDNTPDWAVLSYLAGSALLAGSYGYAWYSKKYKNKEWEPNNYYYAGLGLLALAFASKIHVHGKQEQWW